MKENKTVTLKTLSKSNVWDIQENDVFRLWETAEKDAKLKDNAHRYLDIFKSAFELEEIKIDKPEIIQKYEARGFQTGTMKMEDGTKKIMAVKKRPILRITDLTYENIHHISAAKLIEVLDRNFGGGWESLPQSVQDIIESGFDISTTTLPKDRMHKPGGLYEKKINDGYEVLEIPKGLWTEAIFAKEKPEPEMPMNTLEDFDEDDAEDEGNEETEETDNSEEQTDELDDEDDTFDEDKLTEESYRTTFDENPDELNLEAEDIVDEEVY